MSNPKPTQGQFCWNELATNDTTKAKEFYGSLFGWESHEVDMGENTYVMLKKDDSDIGGMMQIPSEQEGQIPPHWMSYVYVDDIEASASKAQSLGAEIKVPVTQAGDFGRLCVLQDPTGAQFALWQMLEK